MFCWWHVPWVHLINYSCYCVCTSSITVVFCACFQAPIVYRPVSQSARFLATFVFFTDRDDGFVKRKIPRAGHRVQSMRLAVQHPSCWRDETPLLQCTSAAHLSNYPSGGVFWLSRTLAGQLAIVPYHLEPWHRRWWLNVAGEPLKPRDSWCNTTGQGSALWCKLRSVPNLSSSQKWSSWLMLNISCVSHFDTRNCDVSHRLALIWRMLPFLLFFNLLTILYEI